MGTNELRSRDIWQNISGGNAGIAERSFYEVFSKEFEGTDFRIRPKPREFKNIYSNIKLSKKTKNTGKSKKPITHKSNLKPHQNI
jgi:hypothetical protein